MFALIIIEVNIFVADYKTTEALPMWKNINSHLSDKPTT